MAQHYSSDAREAQPHSLPNIETFTAQYGDCPHCTSVVIADSGGEFHCYHCQKGHNSGAVPAEILIGWFYWYCLPGCMPDSDPYGPFATEADALFEARELSGDEDSE